MAVAPMVLLQYHALQVEYALVRQTLLVPNVQLVRQAFMDFPTAKVIFKIFEKNHSLRNHW